MVTVSRRLVIETVESTSLAKAIVEIDNQISKLVAQRADLLAKCAKAEQSIAKLERQKANLDADCAEVGKLIAKRSEEAPFNSATVEPRPSNIPSKRSLKARGLAKIQASSSDGRQHSRKAQIRALTLEILEKVERPQSRQDLFLSLQAQNFVFEGQESPTRAIQKALYRWERVSHVKGEGYWLASRYYDPSRSRGKSLPGAA
ncbi:chromosome segregation ATPase [Rhizobium leguminosarum]|uniref:hypothetical protein n=1 Tax=Rhizobium leguminosarum TaxID=384 RepID=UPI0016123A05|nr:hypothetical protein [Rhizobium leguminosarum]MBB4587948.1 chromosome segregation ATPase [Rhizobium leguminosarum]